MDDVPQSFADLHDDLHTYLDSGQDIGTAKRRRCVKLHRLLTDYRAGQFGQAALLSALAQIEAE